MGNSNAEKPSGIDSVSGITIPVVSSKPIADPISTISRESVISKNASYSTDHGKERVSIRYDISLKTDGTISSVTAVMLSGDHESRQYISRFNNAARSKIVGKKISNLSLVALG